MAEELEPLERAIGVIMRAGVAASAVIMISGLVLVGFGASAGPTVLNIGLILLMMIPASRILVSLVDALRRRDVLLATATTIVSGIIVWQVLDKVL